MLFQRSLMNLGNMDIPFFPYLVEERQAINILGQTKIPLRTYVLEH